MAENYTMKLPADLARGVDWFEHPNPEVGRLLFENCSEHTLNGVIAVAAGEKADFDGVEGVLSDLYVLPADQKVKVYDRSGSDI